MPINYSALRETIGPNQPFMYRLRTALTPIAFWLAIALPVLYLPLLLLGLEASTLLIAFLVLFAGHVLALVGGKEYHRSTD